jgi:beta-galactosidase
MLNGWNIYQGWYHNNLDSIGWALKEFYSWNPDLPFVIAEFGAGSDPRIHTYQPAIFDFSIEYQNLFHEQYLAAARKYHFLDGMCVWTLVDFQVDNRSDAVPHINSKGLLTSDRKKKDAFYLYKASWNKKDPFVHLTAKDWDHRIESQSEINHLTPVSVYSNLNEIELFHNGNSMGVRKTEFPGKAVWMINLETGENLLDAKSENDGHIFEDHGKITMETIAKKDRFILLPSDEICINVGQSRTYFTDALLHDYWIPDREYGSDGFGHLSGSYYTTWNTMPAWEGIREGTGHDIYHTDIDPVFQTFLVGVEEYRVDLEPGQYKVDLYFAEPFSKLARMNSLENTGTDSEGNRVFDVVINGKKYIEGLNLAEEFGEYAAVIKSYTINVEDGGLTLILNGVKGDPVLNGIKIRRVSVE